MPTDHELALKSLHYRKRTLRWIKHAGAGHTGGSLSCVDILNVLYNRILRVTPATFTDAKRDRYIQSKGHSVEALFVAPPTAGFFRSRIWKHLRLPVRLRGTPDPPRARHRAEHGCPRSRPAACGRHCARQQTRRRRLPRLHAPRRRELAEGSNWKVPSREPTTNWTTSRPSLTAIRSRSPVNACVM